MTLVNSIGQLLAGVAIFLLGMTFMEESLRVLAGRPFKIFLKKQTSHKLRALGGSALVTGILQSSSVVNLMVLALVGAGVIQLQNALAVMLGANLGTTLDSWVVASLGFNFKINTIAYILAGVSGISLAFFSTTSRIHQWCKFLLGFSFLFVGLGIIKTGMGDLVMTLDMENFKGLPPVAFLGLGILITAIIQSSSTTIALTLTALYSNAITLPSAMAIVLGSEIGTTLKFFLASAGGMSVKKQLALGNFIVNATTCLLVFILLAPFHELTLFVVGSGDKLIGLVFFQSLLNITAILLFYPFLGRFGDFLSRRFRKHDDDRFIKNISPEDTTLAEAALEKEAIHFIHHVLAMGYDMFEGIRNGAFSYPSPAFSALRPAEKYQYIKNYHGEIHNFFSKVQAAAEHETSIARNEQLASAVRNGMYAAKNLHDISHDIDQLRNSSKDAKYNHYLQARDKCLQFTENAWSACDAAYRGDKFTHLLTLYRNVRESYSSELGRLYQRKEIDNLTEQEISTLLNFNREIFTYYKSIIFALKESLLDEKQADQFDEMPGFIR